MIYSIFKDKVSTYPASLAFVLEDGQEITYEQADHIIDQIAAQLVKAGVKQGNRVGAMFEFESLHPFVFYALDKLNASYVPFDINTPNNQLKVDIEKLGLKIFLKDKDIQIPTSLTSSENNVLLTNNTRDETIPVYIVSSSGTSGNKKWMGLEGAGLGYWEKTEEAQLELKHGHKVLCTRSPAYDARISEYLRALIAGGTLYLISRHERKDMDFIINYCEKHGITELLLIASQLYGDDLEDKIKRLAKAGLKNLIVTGDACSPRLQQLCITYKINLFNAYGPTEALFGISVVKVNDLALTNDNHQAVVPIGYPVGDDIKVHLVDGRLYIESPYLIKGYIGDPEKTALFFPTIMIGKTPTRVFDTGDCFEAKNGLLLFKGRHELSHDSKIIGVKVDAFGIEQLINDYSNALQACVVSKTLSDRTKLVAYLVIKNDVDFQKLVEYLQSWLKAEEMPLLIKLDALPMMTVSDKIDRRALRDRIDAPTDFMSVTSGSTLNQHNDQITQKLEAIWEDLFKVKPKSHDDNFTFNGGDSLYAMRLLKRIQAEIDAEFTHRDLFTLEPITINSIYEKLTNRNVAQEEPIALISPLTHPEKHGKRIFWMPPPLTGDAKYSLQKLAKSFAETHDVNIIGLSDPGLYDISKIPKSMDEAVMRYVNAILKVQPKGPYNLIGYSYGATFSYHIALALESMGHMVHEVHLVDGFSPLFYRNITRFQHANLLNDFAGFMLDVLSNMVYNDPITNECIPALHHLEKEHQINTLIDHLISKVKKDSSKNLLSIMRAHLLFLLKDTPVIKINICVARLYLSNTGKTSVSLIDEMPGSSKNSPDHDFYYWNHYFTSVTRCKDIANCDHLTLVKKADSSKLFFQYTDLQARCAMHALSIVSFPKPALLMKNIAGDFSLTIFDTYYEQKIALIKKGICTSIESLELDSEVFNAKEPVDLCCQDRNALVARFPKEYLSDIFAFLNAFGLVHYTPPNQLSAHDTADNLREIPCTESDLIMHFSFKGHPISKFFYRSALISSSLLSDLKVNHPGVLFSIDNEGNSVNLHYDFNKVKNEDLLKEIEKTMFSLMIKMVPYVLVISRPDHTPTIKSGGTIRQFK